MPTIIFIEPGGAHREVDAQTGQSLMEAAVQHGVKGIDADCGGACSCATCHGYIDEAWRDRIEPADSAELDMLEFAWRRAEGSRLTCQIKVSAGMNGLLIRLPESQG
jgi:ferredoxin, 2Fe-2S